MKQKPTSLWRDLTARSLHLFTLHMHSLNILKVEKRAFCWSLSGILMICYLVYLSVCSVVSPGNTKRAIYILQNAIELGAKPRELLEATLRSMQAGKTQLFCAGDKENVPCEYLLMYYSITCLLDSEKSLSCQCNIIKCYHHLTITFCCVFLLPVVSNSNVHESVRKGSAFQKVNRISDGTGDLQLSSIFGSE